MQIKKVLNNNVVISQDASGREVVLMGKGLGFQKKRGDTVDNALIERSYISTQDSNDDSAQTENLTELLSRIPPELIEFAASIEEQAAEILDLKMKQSLIIALADHIYYAIERLAQGKQIKNALLFEIKTFYPREFALAKRALSQLREKSGISFAEDEAGFIALHLVNATLDEDMPVTMNVTKYLRDVISIIKYQLGADLDESAMDFKRMATHLKFFIHRLLCGREGQPEGLKLLEPVEQQYPEAYACTSKIAAYFQAKTGHKMSLDESIFLTVHIERVRRSALKAR